MPQEQHSMELGQEQRSRIEQVRERLKDQPPLQDILSTDELADAIPAGDYQTLRQWMAAFRSERVAAGMSLADVADATGLQLDDLERLESGNATNPGLKVLFLLARAVNRRLSLRFE